MVWDYIPRDDLSPMMRHYVQIKEEHPDCLIFYRLGDFYELFFEDAVLASRLLELTLTGRDCGLTEKSPMAGVPHYTMDSYAAKLVEKGYKVCVVDQLEDPKEAQGLVKRGITRILTPGTLTDPDSLEKKRNNYLLFVYPRDKDLGLAYADISTGLFAASEEHGSGDLEQSLATWLEALHPSELHLLRDAGNHAFIQKVTKGLEKRDLLLQISDRKVESVEAVYKDLQARLSSGMEKEVRRAYLAQIAASALLDQVYAYEDRPLAHLSRLSWRGGKRWLEMNAASRENLELTENLEDRTVKNTLLSVVDHTKTAMGARKLTSYLEFPLQDKKAINDRLDRVQAFIDDLASRQKIRSLLDSVYDLERLFSKLSFHRGNARDLLSFAKSCQNLPPLQKLLSQMALPALQAQGEDLDVLGDLTQEIFQAIVEEPPISISEGGMIRPGYDQDLDALKKNSEEAKANLLRYEEEERERTGIKNLRLIYRKNQGYFLEITRSNLDRVPEDYRRRQTLKNAERFVSDYLEAQAGAILGASDRIQSREEEIFLGLRDLLTKNALRIQKTADTIAQVDVLTSFAASADAYNYVRPVFWDKEEISIQAGRHPVLDQKKDLDFIANDLAIGQADNRIQIITGPNMAGKSTYMRQNALILIMAHMGSFVPCQSCQLPLVDKIFTRIGARDHLAGGESTFMVEMREMSEILKEATPKSFLLLDEVGRGTGTNDGMSLAWSILEYLSDKLPAMTLFSTHYHELVALADRKDNIKNYTIEIREEKGELLFLRKLIPGYADRSYGIEVARLSGLPKTILDRAQQVMDFLDQGSVRPGAGGKVEGALGKGPSLAAMPEAMVTSSPAKDPAREAFLEQVAGQDIQKTTPMEAMLLLDTLIRKAQGLLEEEK